MDYEVLVMTTRTDSRRLSARLLACDCLKKDADYVYLFIEFGEVE